MRKPHKKRDSSEGKNFFNRFSLKIFLLIKKHRKKRKTHEENESIKIKSFEIFQETYFRDLEIQKGFTLISNL